MRSSYVEIQKVANGYIVSMPSNAIGDGVPDVADSLMKTFQPILDRVFGGPQDPVLDELLRKEPDQETPPAPAVGTDENVHVFSTWSQVLRFLKELDLP